MRRLEYPIDLFPIFHEDEMLEKDCIEKQQEEQKMKHIEKIIELPNFDGYDGEVSLHEVIEKVNEIINILNHSKKEKEG